jgi:hypothetical protein
MLIIVTGFKGDGKTVFATSLLWHGWKKGRQIFSNYGLSFPYEPIKLKEMLSPDGSKKIKDGMVAIDEAQMWMDCRLAGSKKNRLASYLMLQGRKRRIDIILTSQQMGNVDVRFRRNCDVQYECTALKIDYDSRKLRRATVEEKDGHDVDLVKIVMTDFTMNYQRKTIFDPTFFFDKFDSDEFVDLVDE